MLKLQNQHISFTCHSTSVRNCSPLKANQQTFTTTQLSLSLVQMLNKQLILKNVSQKLKIDLVLQYFVRHFIMVKPLVSLVISVCI